MYYYSGRHFEKAIGPCKAQLRLLLDHEVDAEGSNKLTGVMRKCCACKYCKVSTSVITIAGCSMSDLGTCNIA